MRSTFIWLLVLVFALGSGSSRAYAKKKIGDSGPIDRSSVQGGTYCPSPFNGGGNPAATYNYLAAFVADGPTMTVVFRGRLRRQSDNLFNDAALDNVSVVSRSVYDANKQDMISCGGATHEILRFDLMSPGDFMYFNDFEGTVGSEWSFDLYAYHASANQLQSAPLDLSTNPPSGGIGSMGFGKVTDPGPYGIASLEVSGLTPGVEYVISYWWRNNTTLPAAVGDFWVEIYGSDQWSKGGQPAAELPGFSSIGVAWNDIDGDGFDDLFVSSDGQSTKFRNAAGSLSDITSSTAGQGQSRGVVMADYNNDGNIDLVVGDEGGNTQIYEGGPGFQFTDIAAATLVGTNDVDNVTWVDLENDGELELFLTRTSGGGCMLFDHIGGGEFIDKTTPLLSSLTDARGVAWGDYDDDGDQDAFVARYGQPNVLLRNDAGVLVDATTPSLANPCFCSAAAWGDADNDLDLDLYVTNVVGNNIYYENSNGNLAQTNVGLEDGREGVGANWADVDNDGDIDMYVVNEFVNDVLLENLGGAVFAEVDDFFANEWGGDRAVAWSDYDCDGDVDAYVTAEIGELNEVYENLHADHLAGNWLEVRLVGNVSNKSALGAKVILTTDLGFQRKDVSAGEGYLSQNSLNLHFGLGNLQEVFEIKVTWPSGIGQSFNNVAVNQKIVLGESTQLTAAPIAPIPLPVSIQKVYPNPFNPRTSVRYTLAELSRVEAAIYSLDGRRVRTFASREWPAGDHQLVWDGRADGGAAVASGVYLVRLETGGMAAEAKLVLIR